MKIIKEFCKDTMGYQCVIRTNFFCKTIGSLNKLVREAKKDFAHVSDEDLNVIYFGGSRYARTYGISLSVFGFGNIPDEYAEVKGWDLQ